MKLYWIAKTRTTLLRNYIKLQINGYKG